MFFPLMLQRLRMATLCITICFFTRFTAILMFEMLSEDSVFLKIFVIFNKCSFKINFSNGEENGITYFS